MSQALYYGTHRCIEPQNSFPDSAWKLNNTPIPGEQELLLQVSLLNLDSKSFKQIYVECQGDSEKISKKIMDIVSLRGKLHNPVTGTGGIFYGKVLALGKNYPNREKLNPGDEVISLTSLALTPLVIHSIDKIDFTTGQIHINGKAILFASSPLIKAPKDMPLKLVLSVLDEAGAAIEAYRLIKPGDCVTILGASGELGLMCGAAVRKKLGSDGTLIGIRSSLSQRDFDEKLLQIYDEIYHCDILKPLESLQCLKPEHSASQVTINCINNSGGEIFSILATKEGGTIYLASLGSNYKNLCLTLEGMSRDIQIIGYKGYTHGHAEFTLQLLKENPLLMELLNEKLIMNYNRESLTNETLSSSYSESNILQNINLEEYVFVSSAMKKVLDNAFKVASYDCTVLITGESGVGKEVIAKLIHQSSDRSSQPSIKLNCGSISKDLLESELFGYERGAFTGADRAGKKGFFEVAQGGTLFLDEIGEISLDLQVKLLRAIQEKEIYRVGGTTPIKIDVRIVAATNKDLQKLMSAGKFREDLYYRLNVFPIHIPPLRQRKEDILPLILHFTEKYNTKFRLKKSFHSTALEYMINYPWPGNLRELENAIQRLLIGTDEATISLLSTLRALQGETAFSPVNEPMLLEGALEDILAEKEREILTLAKKKYKTTRKMAEALKLSQSTLVRKLHKYNL